MADINWVLFRAAAYLTGKGLTYGQPLVPTNAVNHKVYSICVSPGKGKDIPVSDDDLSVFADNSLDHALVTPVIAMMRDPYSMVRQINRKLKKNGHLVVVVNLQEYKPGLYIFDNKDVLANVSKFQRWLVKAEYQEDNRYLVVLKKVQGKSGLEYPKPITAKRACIARYGALGDAIIMTPLVRKLKEDGYHVTLNISSYCEPVFQNNPYVDNILIQERDMIPNTALGEYWNFWEKQYDKYVNLSESIEGDLLFVEGRAPFFTTKSWRHERANKNYYDYTLLRGGYPDATGTRGELFFTDAERRRAEKFFSQFQGRFVILWALNGSSHHKVYPLMEPTLMEWFKHYPESRVITTGDYQAKLAEFEHPQMVPKAGEWSIRESILATKYANLVIGPETMMTNASGCWATPKITLLSHSSHENLCKYWENDYCLTPDLDISPCYPCHQLHYTKESCPIGEARDVDTGEILGQAPKCALAIQPERLLARMQEVYAKHYLCQ